jgi:GNAT superfamily N-acetyltransferase
MTEVRGKPSLADVTIRPHRVGDMGVVVSRHGVLYNREYGFDITFEALVAKIAGEFIEGFDPATCCARIAEWQGRVVGSAFVVPLDATTAKLRLVIVEPEMRGTGLGRRLVEDCMAFARDAGYRRMSLWTQDILVPARRLYASLGFVMTASNPFEGFGATMVNETWERDL